MKDNRRTSGIGITDCNFMDSNFFEWKIKQEIHDLEVRLNDVYDKIYILSKRKSVESDPVKKDRMNRKMEKLYHVRECESVRNILINLKKQVHFLNRWCCKCTKNNLHFLTKSSM